ncbi:hypothetical protein PRO82_001881 [Candidatus Protochlamydia amoebophila]|nr:hypothetical protein [Candidatus Protochlamydia amoebophila]
MSIYKEQIALKWPKAKHQVLENFSQGGSDKGNFLQMKNQITGKLISFEVKLKFSRIQFKNDKCHLSHSVILIKDDA